MSRARKTPRRGQPTKAEKSVERHRVYVRAGGKCELNLLPTCIRGILQESGVTPWDHWHLVHMHSKRRFGWTEAQGNVLKGGCHVCHLQALHNAGGKPCPPKR